MTAGALRPGEISKDPLTELLRNGAKRLIVDAVEAELHELQALRNEQGNRKHF
jgi:hypothetical protein